MRWCNMYRDKRQAVELMRLVVAFAAFFLLMTGGVPYLLAQALSYMIGIVNSYVLNRKWTFRVTRKANPLEAAKFIIVNGLSLLISTGLLFILYDAVHITLWLAKLVVMGCGAIVNFIGSYLWVFTEKQKIRSEVF
ncbi:hypothetical protein AM501_11690 [Aneurinibacillus migulanus]|nr:membrane protein [Aneurinibacillus migulanus]KPD08135.1 hypothetical protein AM501_11690 [Aneurinibacillus migulanus]